MFFQSSYAGIMPHIESSGENLLSFVNNASSCVKTVLAKPGCFKKNTNHRRFLQKQLKQNITSNIMSNESCKGDETSEEEKCNSKDKKYTLISKTTNKTIRKVKKKKQRHSYEINNYSQVPSPTTDFNVFLNENNLCPETTHLESSRIPEVYTLHHYDPVVNPSNMEGDLHFPSIYDGHVQCYQRSNSESSFTSNCSSVDELVRNSNEKENTGYCKFLTSEDLIRDIDISDLFIPENVKTFENEYDNYLTNTCNIVSELCTETNEFSCPCCTVNCYLNLES